MQPFRKLNQIREFFFFFVKEKWRTKQITDKWQRRKEQQRRKEVLGRCEGNLHWIYSKIWASNSSNPNRNFNQINDLFQSRAKVLIIAAENDVEHLLEQRVDARSDFESTVFMRFECLLSWMNSTMSTAAIIVRVHFHSFQSSKLWILRVFCSPLFSLCLNWTHHFGLIQYILCVERMRAFFSMLYVVSCAIRLNTYTKSSYQLISMDASPQSNDTNALSSSSSNETMNIETHGQYILYFYIHRESCYERNTLKIDIYVV